MIVAQRGSDTYLLAENDQDPMQLGQVYDRRANMLYAATSSVGAILARGYWKPYTGSQDIVSGILSSAKLVDWSGQVMTQKSVLDWPIYDVIANALVQKFNPNHEPPGSSTGGQFTSGSGAGTSSEELKPPEFSSGFNAMQDKVSEFIKQGQDIYSDDIQGYVKKDIVKTISDRMLNDPKAMEALRTIYPTELTGFESDVMRQEVNNRVRQWAITAGDHDPEALSMQMAAKEEFGLKSAEPWLRIPEDRLATASAIVLPVYKERGAFDRRFLRAVYENTQEELKHAGITEVELQRGMEVERGTTLPPAIDKAVSSSHKEVRHLAGDGYSTVTRTGIADSIKSQPLNSWSSESFVAMGFGDVTDRSDGMVVRAIVPASRILSTARTGPGCLGEHEFIVLDTPGKVEVEVKQRTYDRPSY